jgi:DNA-binding NarL/FixJ family response regulator
MKILIVDDHAIVRAGLRQILAEAGDSFTVAEAGDAQVALDLLRTRTFDMVLLDVALPGRNGIELLKQIKTEWKKLPVLMLSMYPEDQYALRALRAGAAGYMTKESAPEQLLSAVRKVVTGGRYVSPALAELLACRLDGETAGETPHLELSDREYEVMRLIASGRTVSEIADALSLSVKTISTYRARILEKMGMKTNAELTHYAVTRGLT